MSGMIPPVSAHSSVEIDNSCNDCCGCWPRRVRKVDPRRPQHAQSSVSLTAAATHNVSQPTLTESGKWEVEIDGVTHEVK